MIKVFGLIDKDFETNGDIVLKPLKAKVHKEDNGPFYLDLEAGLEYVNELTEGRIVVAPTPQGEQAFRIGNVLKTKSKVTTKCFHVFYDSENILISDSYVVNKNCNDALDHLNRATMPQSPFLTASDVGGVYSYRCVRKSLYEAVMAVLGRWGGHLIRDNYNISILNTIGQDNGVTVQYRKNLKEISAEENWDNVVTQLLPTGRDGIQLNAIEPLASIYVYSERQYDIPYTKTVNFSQDNIDEDDYKDPETGETDMAAFRAALVADLREKAAAYVEQNSVPMVNYTMRANLERITDIGDIVEVIDSRLGLDLLTRVISYDYDCILGKYTEIEFGNFKNTLSGLIDNITNSVDNSVAAQIQTAGDIISGQTTEQIKEVSTAVDQMAAALQAEIDALKLKADRSTMTLAQTEPLITTSANTYAIAPLTLVKSVGDKLTATPQGGIRIGAGIDKIMVSGVIAYDAINSTAPRQTMIAKNSTDAANIIGWARKSLTTGDMNAVEVMPVVANVQENDIIYLYYYTDSATDVISGESMGGRTYLTVETL